MKEEWREVKEYEGKYWVSNIGRVRSIRKILKPYKGYHKYLSVVLCKNPKGIHRLVAMAFLDNPNNLPEVNHKDEVRDNNMVDNLEWCTRVYNANYGTAQERKANAKRGLIKKGYKDKGNPSKKIIQIDPITENIIKEWDSINQAWKIGKYDKSAIRNCLNGNRITHKGYKWEYA